MPVIGNMNFKVLQSFCIEYCCYSEPRTGNFFVWIIQGSISYSTSEMRRTELTSCFESERSTCGSLPENSNLDSEGGEGRCTLHKRFPWGAMFLNAGTTLWWSVRNSPIPRARFQLCLNFVWAALLNSAV